MKKIIAILSIVSMCMWSFGPAFSGNVLAENGTTTISTSLTASVGGGDNAAPIVKAKWEMNGPYAAISGTDNNPVAGAQFNPSGQYQVGKQISICAIATDPDGIDDIDSVYGDVYYPNIKIHEDPQEPGREGCGKPVGTECRMVELTKSDGLALFCGNIRNNNTNLPTFNAGYDYDEICKADGELQKETAAVFCCDKTLSYEDPAGDYKVMAFAQDDSALDSNLLENTFVYQPVTSFETDFSAVGYGSVRLNTHKIISGDLNWAAAINADGATIRNIGNTRAEISVLEDDMGLGKTDDNWNVRYDGRIGNNEADWQDYDPNSKIWLKKALDLSELNEVDFSIFISKFPPATGPNYTGSIVLGSRMTDPLECEETPTATLTVTKEISPENDPGKFNLRIDGVTKVANVGDGGTTGAITLPVGLHTVSETAGTSTDMGDYTAVIGGDCAVNGTITLAAGDNKTCTITNTLIPPQPAMLIVNKTVSNTHGGNNVAGDFSLFVDATQVASGATSTFAPGVHTVSETGVSGYQATFSGDCDSSGDVTLVAGQTKTCTITNADLPANVTLVKVLQTGTSTLDSFKMRIDGTLVPNNSSFAVTSNTAHAITEDAMAGYHFVSMTGAGCPAALGGTVTLSEGQAIVCTITNAAD